MINLHVLPVGPLHRYYTIRILVNFSKVIQNLTRQSANASCLLQMNGKRLSVGDIFVGHSCSQIISIGQERGLNYSIYCFCYICPQSRKIHIYEFIRTLSIPE